MGRRQLEEARALLRELVVNEEESEEKPVLIFDGSEPQREVDDDQPWLAVRR